jgi:antitoxin (DNA-binding transcriptional repressor) of toxin-antitoxin stability system
MSSRAISVADLKNNLSAHLARVRHGEGILIRDRRTPIAKIVPLVGTEDLPAEEIALAAEGKVRLPTKRLPPSFWKTRGPRVATDRALEILREDRDARRAVLDSGGDSPG